MIDPRWLDPSGWRPYPLQMSVPPETVGIPWDEWQRTQPLYDRASLILWTQAHDPETVRLVKEAKKKRPSR